MREKNTTMIIDDIEDIVDEISDIYEHADEYEVVLVGYYETIVGAMNMLLKNTDAEFVAGELYPPEWDEYDDAYYMEYDGEEICVGKARWENHDKYITFAYDKAFVEEDFYKMWLTNNTPDDVVVFGYHDIHQDNDHDHVSICMDDDELGFCFCIGDDANHTKFKYRGNKKLSQDMVSKIINEYVF